MTMKSPMKTLPAIGSQAHETDDGVDVTDMLGTFNVVNLHEEPQRQAFNAYRVAFNANAMEPNLRHAAALVEAWNAFADIMGVDRV